MDYIETLEPLDYQAADDIAFSFSADLVEAETVSAAAVSVEVTEGKDINPELAKVGSATINPTEGYVVQRIQGRFPGVTYKLRCKMTLSSGRILVKTAYLPIVRL